MYFEIYSLFLFLLLIIYFSMMTNNKILNKQTYFQYFWDIQEGENVVDWDTLH